MNDPLPRGVEQDFVIPPAVDVDDEADSAGILLVGGVIQPVGLGQMPAVLFKRHCYGLVRFKK